MSFTQRPGSGLSRQTIRRRDRYIKRTVNCFIDRHLSTGSTYGLLCLVEPCKGAWLKDFWNRGTQYACCLDAHTSTSPFGVLPCTRKLDCNGMEPGRL
ncbi:hypothetical protein TNCV_2734521 [Trichonephila clavipes]|nr:hypothetical protein TNCV_2734521 [Trichonephila clavipes]